MKEQNCEDEKQSDKNLILQLSLSKSKHGCYEAFKKRSGFILTKTQRIKMRSNLLANKLKRVDFLKYFLPYHKLQSEGKFEIIFIDETGFNLNKQGMSVVK